MNKNWLITLSDNLSKKCFSCFVARSLGVCFMRIIYDEPRNNWRGEFLCKEVKNQDLVSNWENPTSWIKIKTFIWNRGIWRVNFEERDWYQVWRITWMEFLQITLYYLILSICKIEKEYQEWRSHLILSGILSTVKLREKTCNAPWSAKSLGKYNQRVFMSIQVSHKSFLIN